MISLPYFKNLGSFVALGDRARDQRDWREAARNYSSYLRRRPKDAGIWVQYGHALKEQGLYLDASEAYHRALALMPFDADLHLQIGHLNKLTGMSRAAIASYRRALELDPDFRPAQDELDRMQSFPENRAVIAWQVETDRRLGDALTRVRLLEQRIIELEDALKTQSSPKAQRPQKAKA